MLESFICCCFYIRVRRRKQPLLYSLTMIFPLIGPSSADSNVLQGVTYCGDSKASTLTMNNVPWHEEVVGFVKEFTKELPDYEIASEHEHSNCILVAHKRVSTEWTVSSYTLPLIVYLFQNDSNSS